MKKLLCILLALCCALPLTACSQKYPEAAADGAVWDESWTMLGAVLGVAEPGNGLTLLENPVVLTGDDTHYATWTIGDSTNYVNADGDDTDLYEAELYLLLYGCADESAAQTAMSDWMERENNTYTVTETTEITCNGQDYVLLNYEVDSENNPYSRGISAFGIYGNYAVCAELSCQDSFEGNEQAILNDFLNGCHYAAEQKGEN